MMTSTRSKNNIKMVFCSQKYAYTVIGPLIEDGYAVMITRDAAGFWVVEATMRPQELSSNLRRSDEDVLDTSRFI